MVSWPKRDLLPEIRPALLLNLVWTAAVVRLYELGYVIPIDPTPHSLLSGALGFFLTFRANEGYARCNEARKVRGRGMRVPLHLSYAGRSMDIIKHRCNAPSGIITSFALP